jgi:hypothetical protein
MNIRFIFLYCLALAGSIWFETDLVRGILYRTQVLVLLLSHYFLELLPKTQSA